MWKASAALTRMVLMWKTKQVEFFSVHLNSSSHCTGTGSGSLTKRTKPTPPPRPTTITSITTPSPIIHYTHTYSTHSTREFDYRSLTVDLSHSACLVGNLFSRVLHFFCVCVPWCLSRKQRRKWNMFATTTRDIIITIATLLCDRYTLWAWTKDLENWRQGQ